MSFKKDYKNRSDTEKGFKKKLERIEGEAFTPPFSTIGFDQPQLDMSDLNKLRSMKVNNFNK